VRLHPLTARAGPDQWAPGARDRKVQLSPSISGVRRVAGWRRRSAHQCSTKECLVLVLRACSGPALSLLCKPRTCTVLCNYGEHVHVHVACSAGSVSAILSHARAWSPAGAQPGIRSPRIPAMASSQGDVRSFPMAYPAAVRPLAARCQNSRLYLYGQTRAHLSEFE
jgi:hypothetical protein